MERQAKFFHQKLQILNKSSEKESKQQSIDTKKIMNTISLFEEQLGEVMADMQECKDGLEVLNTVKLQQQRLGKQMNILLSHIQQLLLQTSNSKPNNRQSEEKGIFIFLCSKKNTQICFVTS